MSHHKSQLKIGPLETAKYSIQEGLKSIKISPVQTFFSILGIIIGVASLVSILALGDGLETFARNQISSTTSILNLQLASVQRLNKDGVYFDNPDFPLLTLEHKQELRAKFDTSIHLFYSFNHAMQFKVISNSSSIVGYLTALEDLQTDKKEWKYGAPTENDLNKETQKIWVSTSLLKQLKEAKLDTTSFELFGKTKEIAGVFNDDKTPFLAIYPTFIPDSILKTDAPSIFFKVAELEQVNEVKKALMDWAATSFPGKEKFLNVNTYEGRIKQAEQGIAIFKIVMGLITGISVLVGGIGVMNVLLMSIKERTPEIGIRKAIGAKRVHIVLQFLSESVTISTLGSFIGLLFSMLFMEIVIPIIKATTKIEFHVSWTLSTLLIVSFLAVLIGVIFGTYPAYKASRLLPIDAIQRV